MDNVVLSMLLRDVVSLVEAAGERIIEEWQRTDGPRGGRDKAAVDEEIEQSLRTALLQLLNVDFWGEETGSDLTGNQYCWVVDPHDGTSDFLQGLMGSSVSVALLRDQVPVLGVVYAPISPDRGRDCIAWAEGLPYLLRNGQPVQTDLSEKELDRQSIVFVSAAAAGKPYANLELCAPARFLALSSVAYRLARVAAGDGICGVSLVALSAHDVAGAHALLRGACGVLLDHRGEELTYRNMYMVSLMCFGGAPDVCAELAERPWPSIHSAATEPSRRISQPPRYPELSSMRRAQGCLAGLLAGDNLGAQVEFMDAASVAQRIKRRPLLMEDGGTWNILAGQPTDDGELALALARSIMASGGTYNCEAAAVAYVDWLHSSPFDMGGTTRQALTGPLRYPEMSVSDACSKAASLTSQANGALMRVAPIGIAAYADPTLAASWARQDAVLTHPHPVCLEANAAYAAAIAAGIGSGRREDMIEAAFGVLGNGESALTVRGCLEAALVGHLPEEYQQQMGWVLIALQNAFYHLGAGDKAGHAIVETIRRGGDTDTNACIVGALVGAVDGLEGLENAWLQKLQSCRSHNESVKPRPIRFWPDDIFILAKALVTGSTPPS